MQTLRFVIAGHGIDLHNANSEDVRELIPTYSPFQRVDENDEPVATTVTLDDAFRIDCHGDEIGQFDCGGANHGVYRTADGGYQFEISTFRGTMAALMQTDSNFSQVRVALTGESWADRNYGLNNAMMLAFAFSVADKGTLLMHASVIRNRGRAYLFLGSSGTGKSTHTRLWREWIPGSDLINDDNPALRFVDGKTVVYGTPWSGKTPCYRRISVPVHGIVKLEQRPYNKIERLGIVRAFAMTMPSASNMKWDKRVHGSMCDTFSHILGCTPVYLLGCLPDEDAARLCYKTVTAQ